MPKGDGTRTSVPVPSTGDITVTGEMSPEAVEKAAQIAALHRQLRLAALKITTAKDWVDLDGAPYLSASGCHRLAALFRIRQRNLRTERVTEPDGHFTVIVVGEASSEVLDSGGWVEVVGAASSNDRFLTRGGRAKAALGDVLKKAHTNWFGRAIRQLVGLSGLTWEELEEVGIRRSEAAKVEFAKPNDDLVWLEVPFKAKDQFREVVRRLSGHPPRWDGQRRAWGVPTEVAEHPEVKALLGKESSESELLFGGEK